MTRPSRLLAVFVLLLPACGGSEPVGPDITVSSVSVSPLAATVTAIGETVQFSATVVGSDGAPMASEPVTWTIGDGSVAQVSGSGLVTGLTAGETTITAAAGSVEGSAQLSVCSDTETVNLTAGGSVIYDTDQCILLPAGAASDRYRVAVFRPTAVENRNDVTNVRLQVTGLPAAAMAAAAEIVGSPNPLRTGGLGGADMRAALRIAAGTERAHLEALDQDARLWAELGPGALLRSPRARPLGSPRLASSPSKIQLDPRTLGSCSASSSQTVTAVLIHENEDLAIYQDSAQQTQTPVTAYQAFRMASYYSDHAAQMIVDYFGAPSDIDGNGKFVVFVTPAVSGETAARVWSGDFYSQSSCTTSNEMELIYFNNELVQVMDDIHPSYQALETVAHEAKHLVSYYHRIAASDRLGSPQFHPSWIEEGTAEIAGGMSSRIAWASIGGPAVGTMVGVEDVRPGGGGVVVHPENYGILLRMARTIFYLASQPNSLVVTPLGAEEGHNEYGTGWNFHRWLGDAYGNAATPFADAALFRQLNDSLTPGGVEGLTAVTDRSYGDLLAEFFRAVALHRVGPDPERAITSYDFTTATDILQIQPDGVYPWPVTEQSSAPAVTTPAGFNTATYIGPIGASGVRIHDFQSSGVGGGAHIAVRATQPAQMIVVRVR